MSPTATHTLFSILLASCTMLSVDSFSSLSSLTIPQRATSAIETLRKHSRMHISRRGLRMSDLERELPAGSVDQQRAAMNRQMMEREAAYEGMKRRIRAESFEHGEADYRGLFARFDRDKNGALDRREFEQLCGQMGMRTEALTEEERQVMLSEAGVGGMVRVREFLQWVGVVTSPPPPKATPQPSAPSRRERAPETGAEGGGRMWSYGESFFEDSPAEAVLPASPPPPSSSSAPSARASAAPGRLGAVRLSTSHAPAKTAGDTQAGEASAELDAACRLVRAWVDPSLSEGALQDVVHLLLFELGIQEHSLVGMAVSAPGVFGVGAKDLRRNVEFLQELGLSKTKICKLCVSCPQLLQSGVDKKEEVAEYMVELGVPRDKMGKCLASSPQLLGLNIQSNLQPTVEFLVQEAGVPSAKLGALILAFPRVLSYSIELNLRPKLIFLTQELGVDKQRMGALLAKFPQILGLSVSSNLRPTVEYMVEDLGLELAEVCKIVQQHPQLLGLSVEGNLKHKVSYLVDELGVPAQRLASVINAFPTLLSLSVARNLRPKVQFLLEEAGYDLEDIVRSPNLLAYSLERRMRPRFLQLQRMGTRLALGSLLSYSDKEFERRYGGSA